jgi:hypothetical protein
VIHAGDFVMESLVKSNGSRSIVYAIASRYGRHLIFILK